MAAIDDWLKQATRHLSSDSAAQVRAEIQDHYESARDAAMTRGATTDEAGRLALAALGDPKTANRQYRKVLLTSAEARILRDVNWETQFVCSRPLLKQLLLYVPAIVLFSSMALFVTGPIGAAQVLLVGGIDLAIFFTAPFLPIYTPSRSRVFRYVKWIVVTGTMVLVFWQYVPQSLWLLISSSWPLGWIEWRKASVRRKLPIA